MTLGRLLKHKPPRRWNFTKTNVSLKVLNFRFFNYPEIEQKLLQFLSEVVYV